MVIGLNIVKNIEVGKSPSGSLTKFQYTYISLIVYI